MQRSSFPTARLPHWSSFAWLDTALREVLAWGRTEPTHFFCVSGCLGQLWKEGAGQVMKEGVLHRGPVGASKRGRARVGVYSLGPEERQEAGSSTTLGAG